MLRCRKIKKKSMIKKSTYGRYITESWYWWEPAWRAVRNGFVRCKVKEDS
jgi:hypothetical protein